MDRKEGPGCHGLMDEAEVLRERKQNQSWLTACIRANLI